MKDRSGYWKPKDNTALLTFIIDSEHKNCERNITDLISYLDNAKILISSTVDSFDDSTIIRMVVPLHGLIPFPNSEEEYKSSAALAIARLLASDILEERIRVWTIKTGVVYGKFDPLTFIPES